MAGDPYESIATVAPATKGAATPDPYAAIAGPPQANPPTPADPYAGIAGPPVSAPPPEGQLVPVAPKPSWFDRLKALRPAPGAVDAGISKSLGGATVDTPLVKLPEQRPTILGAKMGVMGPFIEPSQSVLPRPSFMPSYEDPREWEDAIYKGVAPTLTGLSTPKNAALLTALPMLKGAKLAASVVDAYFAGTMAKQFGEQAADFEAVLDDPKSTWQDKVSKIANMGTTAVFTGMAATGAGLNAKEGVADLKAGPEPIKPMVLQPPKAAPGEVPPQIPIPSAAKGEQIQAQADAERTAARAKEVEDALAKQERVVKSQAGGAALNKQYADEEAAQKARVADFTKAQAEEAAAAIKGNQLKGGESVALGQITPRRRVVLARPAAATSSPSS